MAVKYDELEDRGGTIYNKTTEKGYSDPTALASDLGVTSDKINWSGIAKSVGATAGTQAQQSVATNTPAPSPVVTSTAARKTETDNAKQYVQYAGSPDVFEKSTGRYISNAEATQNNIWNNIQTSTEARPAIVSTPIESIQQVFGADWKPSVSPAVQAQGIYGAVKIGDQVYTIGSGGSPVNSDQFKAIFGTEDQTGIVGTINLEQAVKLGITPSQNDISSFNAKMTEDMYSAKSLGDVATKAEDISKKAYAEADKVQQEIKTAYTNVINTIKSFSTTKADEKAKESEELKLDEKSNAISKAQTVYSEVKASYDTYIQGLLMKGGLTTADIGNMTAQAKSQQAIQLAPLESAISIAQGNYNRAKTQLDEWSDDYNTNFEMLLKGYQANIDMLGSDLTYEQSKAKTQAEQKLALLTQSYNDMKENQAAVKQMMLMPSLARAGITINDSWETAYEKASPFIASEADFAKQVEQLDLELKKAQIAATGRSNRSSTPAFDSGIEGIANAKQLTAFQASVKVAQGNLESGQNWGDVWNNVKKQFPNVSNEVIDAYLGGSVQYTPGSAYNAPMVKNTSGWATPGYYETWKAKQNGTKTTTITEAKREVIGIVNAMRADNVSQSEINGYISAKGYDTNDTDFN